MASKVLFGLYVSAGGVCGYGYKVHDTYTSSNRKRFIVPYALFKGFIGIPAGMFLSIVIPVLMTIELGKEIDNHFNNKE